MQINDRFTGNLIFEHNPIKRGYRYEIYETVEEATRQKVSLSRAQLSNNELCRIDLSGQDLQGASFKCCDLWLANLSNCNLSYVNFERADLTGVNFSNSIMTGAVLRGAELRSANFEGVDLSGFEYDRTRILPDGDIVGYINSNGKIIKVLIPKEAKRASEFDRVCFSEYAKVFETGDVVIPDDPFDDSLFYKIKGGIRFYITESEAIKNIQV